MSFSTTPQKIVKKGKRLAIWGAGTHALRLLKNSCLPEAKMVAFIDANANYQGEKLVHRPILSPSQFSGNTDNILISS
jgi:FlaA1/EpsC-like NDP-sugar epimerase